MTPLYSSYLSHRVRNATLAMITLSVLFMAQMAYAEPSMELIAIQSQLVCAHPLEPGMLSAESEIHTAGMRIEPRSQSWFHVGMETFVTSVNMDDAVDHDYCKRCLKAYSLSSSSCLFGEPLNWLRPIRWDVAPAGVLYADNPEGSVIEWMPASPGLQIKITANLRDYDDYNRGPYKYVDFSNADDKDKSISVDHINTFKVGCVFWAGIDGGEKNSITAWEDSTIAASFVKTIQLHVNETRDSSDNPEKYEDTQTSSFKANWRIITNPSGKGIDNRMVFVPAACLDNSAGCNVKVSGVSLDLNKISVGPLSIRLGKADGKNAFVSTELEYRLTSSSFAWASDIEKIHLFYPPNNAVDVIKDFEDRLEYEIRETPGSDEYALYMLKSKTKIDPKGFLKSGSVTIYGENPDAPAEFNTEFRMGIPYLDPYEPSPDESKPDSAIYDLGDFTWGFGNEVLESAMRVDSFSPFGKGDPKAPERDNKLAHGFYERFLIEHAPEPQQRADVLAHLGILGMYGGAGCAEGEIRANFEEAFALSGDEFLTDDLIMARTNYPALIMDPEKKFAAYDSLVRWILSLKQDTLESALTKSRPDPGPRKYILRRINLDTGEVTDMPLETVWPEALPEAKNESRAKWIVEHLQTFMARQLPELCVESALCTVDPLTSLQRLITIAPGTPIAEKAQNAMKHAEMIKGMNDAIKAEIDAKAKAEAPMK